jgi:hypothetical protein
VDLLAIQTHYFNWEPVYDDSGTDYLYTRVSGAWRAVVNGIASVLPLVPGPWLNYDFTGQFVRPPPTTGGSPRTPSPKFFPASAIPPGAGTAAVGGAPGVAAGVEQRGASTLRAIVLNPPAALPGNDPTNTHTAIRHRLSTPRGQLYVFWGAGMESGVPAAGSSLPPNSTVASLFLESPRASGNGHLATDCKNGPIPKLMGVVEAVGDALTMTVDFAIETFVNETDLNGVGPQGALLSNRFSQVHEVKEDSYTVITTEGTAVFRTDFVYSLPEAPDSRRNILFMPIPQGFKRALLYCRGRPDVTGVEYAYQDTQVSVNFVAGPFVKAASISAVHRQAVFNQPDVWASGPLAVYERVLGIAANKHFAYGHSKDERGDRKSRSGSSGSGRKAKSRSKSGKIKGGGAP